jgi:hypothetical protein
MAKRDNKTKQAKSRTTATSRTESASNPMEQRLAAIAEQLGWIAGTIHAKAEGWMDGDTLSKQIANVRDGASQLLDQLRNGATNATEQRVAVAPRRQSKGRSGGAVDAPGKKHRKPPVAGAAAKVANSQAAKVRAAKTMAKTNRRRGRA